MFKSLSVSKSGRGILWWVVFGLLLLLHLVKNFTDIDHATFWQDESKNYYAAQVEPFSYLTYIAIHQDQPPLHYYFLHQALRHGTSERYLRGTSWAFILALVVCAAFIMRDDPPWLRLLFIFIFLFYYFSRYLSQEMRPYAMGILLTFISSVLFLRMCYEPSRRNAVKYALAQFAGMYTFSLALSSFLAQGAFAGLVLLLGIKKDGLKQGVMRYINIVIALGTLAVLFLPYVIAVSLDQAEHDPISKKEMFAQIFVAAHYVKGIQWLLQQDEWFDVPGYVLMVKHGGLLLMIIAVITELRRGNIGVLYWAMFIVINIMFVRVLLYERHFYSPRYMVPCYFAACYLVARGFYTCLAALAGWMNKKWSVPLPRIKGACMIFFLLGIVGFSAPPTKRFLHYLDAPLPERPWRALRTQMKGIAGPKVVMFDHGRLGSMYQYVCRNDPDIVFAPEYFGPDDLSDPTAILREGIYERFSDAQFFFYIQSHMTEDDVVMNDFRTRMEAYGFSEMVNFNNNLDGYKLVAYRVE